MPVCQQISLATIGHLPDVRILGERAIKLMMNRTRTEAVTALLDDLAAFEINRTDYWDDLEPQGMYDTTLTGLINSLLAFCQTLGWSELVGHLRDVTPLRGNAVESLEILQRFVVPEARRLLAASDIEKPQSPNQWFWGFSISEAARSLRASGTTKR